MAAKHLQLTKQIIPVEVSWRCMQVRNFQTPFIYSSQIKSPLLFFLDIPIKSIVYFLEHNQFTKYQNTKQVLYWTVDSVETCGIF